MICKQFYEDKTNTNTTNTAILIVQRYEYPSKSEDENIMSNDSVMLILSSRRD